MNDITAIIIVVLLLAAGVGGFLYWKKREADRIAAMSPEERELFEAESEYKQNTKMAQTALAKTQKEYDKNVKQAEKALAQAEQVGTRKLKAYSGKSGSVTLYDLHLVTPSGTVNFLEGECTATLDSAGNLARTQKTSLGRMVGGGLLLGPAGALAGGMLKKNKTFDDRELYLLIESATVGALIQCNPDDGAKVREVAMLINTQARNAQNINQQRIAGIQQATATLEATRGDTAALEASKSGLAQVQADTGRLQAAQAAVPVATLAAAAPHVVESVADEA